MQTVGNSVTIFFQLKYAFMHLQDSLNSCMAFWNLQPIILVLIIEFKKFAVNVLFVVYLTTLSVAQTI